MGLGTEGHKPCCSLPKVPERRIRINKCFAELAETLGLQDRMMGGGHIPRERRSSPSPCWSLLHWPPASYRAPHSHRPGQKLHLRHGMWVNEHGRKSLGQPGCRA